MTKPLLIHLHGGTPFDSREQYTSFVEKYWDPLEEEKRRWPKFLPEQFPEADVWLPKMPAKDNAEYEIWKIAFENMLPRIQSEKIIVTARSLGTVFLMKWLSENSFPRKIHAMHLVGCVFDGEGIEEEGMADFILDPEKLKNVSAQVGEIHLWHSTDDSVCPW